MKQLLLDAFLVRDEAATSRAEAREIQQDDRSVLQAFAEYEDVEQNVYVARPRHRLKQGDIPYCKCKPLAGSSETCGASCENRVTQTECIKDVLPVSDLVAAAATRSPNAAALSTEF
ncbi:hypothetical protein PF003_g20214 [Phytophthora fragariae]|nr:hypothetical protein PF003_g20214 [Phytophthora fragariae]